MAAYPPFEFMASTAVQQLAAQVNIQYFTAKQLVFSTGDAGHQHLYLVREGQVTLSNDEGPVDICDEGDLFGVRSMLTEKPYVLTAVTAEESLLYLVPIAAFKAVMAANAKVALYFSEGLAAGQTVLGKPTNAAAPGNQLHGLRLETYTALTVPPPGRALVQCLPDTTIQAAAQQMTTQRVGSIVITAPGGQPLGICTDADLRKQVATGLTPPQASISTIMSHPVLTTKPEPLVHEVLLAMMHHQVHHLCITEDGTPNTPALGIVAERDLLLLQGNNPVALVKSIKKSSTVAELPPIRNQAEALLRQYLQQELAMPYLTGVITAVNDALIVKAIALAEAALAQEGMQRPTADFCWLQLGSEGREEQLLRTDLDNAIVYTDPPPEEAAATQAYYLALGQHVVNTLVACGFERCPADMMASNPKWCAPLSTWKGYFKQWITVPEPKALMMASIFFDFRGEYGNLQLVRQLEAHISTLMEQESLFLNHLASNALQNPPPLSFFKNFIVEKGGEHRDTFDVKLRAMMPLADAARVLCLQHRLFKEKSTFKRFELMAATEPKNAALYQEAATAYERLMRVRVQNGLRHQDSGRYIDVKQLGKMERQMLKNTFEPVHALQKMLSVRFQSAYFNAG